MTAVQNSLSLTEKEVIKSFTEHELISVIHERSIQEAEEEFNSMVKYCSVTAGLKHIPDPVVDGNLFKLCTTQYKNFTFNEIRKAVYMNSIGELNTRHEHFGLFDTTFLSKVMTDWLILKTRTRQRVAALLPPAKVKEPTDADLYQGLLNFINTNKKFPEMWAWSRVYQHMDSMKMITESNDEKRVIFEKAKAKINAQVENELLSVKGFIERQGIMDGAEERAKVESRKELTIKHLQHLIKPSKTIKH
jgi:hypothetical protein